MTAFGLSSLVRRDRSAWAAAALAAIVTVVTITHNTWSAAGADASGYLNQAELWLEGRLKVPLPLAARAPWPDADWSFCPLGFRPGTTPHTMVPTYAPGLPLTLAVSQIVGGRGATHVVVPLLAGALVWATFVLGRQTAGPAVGLVAAIAIAASPIVLRQSTHVMADVPAAAWWTIALALAQQGTCRLTARAVWLSGLACAIALLTRPNLAPMTLGVFGALLAGRHRAGTERAIRWRGLGSWALIVASGVGAVAMVQTYLYGAPWRTGYGSGEDLYELKNVVPNAKLYADWLLDSHSPLVLLGLGAGLLRHRARGETNSWYAPLWPLALSLATCVACYLPYAIFEDWWYIRFLIPALPAAFVMMAITLVGLARLAPRLWQVVALAAAVLIVAVVFLRLTDQLGSLTLQRAELRYQQIATALEEELPRNAVLIAVQHSGSLRYYTRKPIVRWDWVRPDRLDEVMAYTVSTGGYPYLIFDQWEEPRFRERFASATTVGQLDWPPRIELRSATRVRLYDPADRERFLRGDVLPSKMLLSIPGRRAPVAVPR